MYSNSMSCVKPVDILTALRLILNSSPYLLKKIPFKVSELDGSMWEELKQNKQKRKDKCSDERTTRKLKLFVQYVKLSVYAIY